MKQKMYQSWDQTNDLLDNYRRSGLGPIFCTNSVSAKNSNSLKNVLIKLQMFWSIQLVYILHLLKVLTTTIHLQKKKTTKNLLLW